jgi:hypothetical protein
MTKHGEHVPEEQHKSTTDAGAAQTEAAALPAGFRVEPKRKVVLLRATIVDGKDHAIGDEVEVDGNVASILLGDGGAQTPEDAAKAKEENAKGGAAHSATHEPPSKN